MYCAHAGTILRQLALATSHLIIGSRPMSVGGTVSGDGPSGQQAAIIALAIRNCCLVADAVQVEPVSPAKFPANREKNREFYQIRALGAILKADTRANSEPCSEIPYATEQGIISAEQGILAQEQGISPAKTEIIAE